MDLYHLSSGIPDNVMRLDHAGATQTHALAQHQPLVFLVGLLPEIRRVDKQFSRERQLPLTQLRLAGMPGSHQQVVNVIVDIGQNHFQRIEYAHGAGRAFVQIIANGVLQHGNVRNTIGTGGPHHLAEAADRCRRDAATTQPGDGRHARIIPAFDYPLVHQLFQLALAGHGVTGVQPPELVLPRSAFYRQVVEKPVVERTMILELQCTDRMGDALYCVFLTVSEIVGGVDRPGVAGLVMMVLADPVENWIAHVHIGVGHINFCAQHPGAVGKLTLPHSPQEIEILRDRTLPVRAVATSFRQCAAERPGLIGVQFADIGIALLHQVFGPGIQLLKVG